VAFTKTGSVVEATVQRIVAAKLPGTTPEISGSTDVDGNGMISWSMPNLEEQGYVSLISLLEAGRQDALSGYRAALGLLGRVHALFLGCVDEFIEIGVPEVGTLEVSPPTTQMLDSSDPEWSEMLSAIAKALLAGPPDSWSKASVTLLHGDLHPANVLLSPENEVMILDWGEARIGLAAWDLGLVTPVMVQSYIDSGVPGGMDTAEFRAQVRWAGILKAAQSLQFVHDMPIDSPLRATAIFGLKHSLSGLV
jgi:hypothetical protein